jgi:CspA family cold shock protein
MPRVTGTVEFFHPVKGYGFIVPDGGGDEVFVHRTDLGQSCMQTVNGIPDRVLVQAQRVAYELVSSGNNKGSGKKAAQVELIPA